MCAIPRASNGLRVRVSGKAPRGELGSGQIGGAPTQMAIKFSILCRSLLLGLTLLPYVSNSVRPNAQRL